MYNFASGVTVTLLRRKCLREPYVRKNVFADRGKLQKFCAIRYYVTDTGAQKYGVISPSKSDLCFRCCVHILCL